ncbi:hypothetical protein JW899_01280 [Candidatus Uhrbacteria bacterium]|nr:hypothetical protein [Candidatus Uhrbacteria bacterium]
MTKYSKKSVKVAAVGMMFVGFWAFVAPVLAAVPSGIVPSQSVIEDWAVTDLTFETPVRQVESFKVDRDFVAWTEIDPEDQIRRLFSFDSGSVRLLAEMPRQEWDQDYGNGFFDSVEGNYDVADGRVVWSASDGTDREIWSYNGFDIVRVSDNTYDDNHPVTSGGRVAWTSYPGSGYNLMVSDRRGTRRIDGWHVKNYAFAGPNLYWLNRLPEEDWFRVFRENGQDVKAVGKGDDRAIVNYFWTDRQGTAAWEYSTKQWGYDKRETFISHRGAAPALRVIQRDVPPNITRIEDIADRSVILNVTNLLQSDAWDRVQLISVNGQERYLDRYVAVTKVRYFGNGLLVRHAVPDTSSALIIGNGMDSTDFILNEHVIHDRFEAADGLVAGALLKGGLLVRTDDGTSVIPTGGQVSRLAIGQGCVAWVEGEEGNGRLRSACPTVAVRGSNGQVSRVSGRLVKEAGNPDVYLFGIDGQRYRFPSETQFWGWYRDFSSVRTVSSAEMRRVNLAGSVLIRPNYRPVMVSGDPKVYGVTGDGELRWITSGDVMDELYGQGWEGRVATIPVRDLLDYHIGAPISSAAGGRMALAF